METTFSNNVLPIDPPLQVGSPNNLLKPRVSVDTISLDDERSSVRTAKILIVDDEQLVIKVVKRYLSAEGYVNFVTVSDSKKALETINREAPDVVLSDIMMPDITGLDLLRIRQKDPVLKSIPFLILSASSENAVKREALELGATDFLNKPVDPIDLSLRVQNALILKRHHDHLANYANELETQVRARTKQLEQSREQIIHCLARAAEYRDNETGEHIIRVGKYCRVIADELGYDADYCREIELAAQLHDVGKIGIPDSVLLNPGKLTTEEFEIIKTHCGVGMEIMEPLASSDGEQIRRHTNSGGFIMDGVDSPMLELAASIARSHHEKWDGTGYPAKLAAESIPIEGRICCVADVYDALCSERPYKPKFPIKKCLETMLSERGTRFDPQILDAFFDRIEDIEAIRKEYNDQKAVEQIQKLKSLENANV
jgi:putative two-component system response regulator